MAGEPDVRVRLSAEGVAEVIAAFKKIQAELVATQAKAKAASAGAAGPTDFFSKLAGGAIDFKGALAGVSSAFAAVGLAITAVKLVEFAKAGVDAAEATEHLAQSLGVTVENLQALQVLGRSTGVDTGKMQQGFARLADRLADLRDGLPDVVQMFRQLGLAAKDFNGKDLAESMQRVAQAVADLPPEEQFRAMRDFFSDRQGSLLPFITALSQGKESLQDIVQRYKDLGLVLDGKVVKSAAKVGDAFGAMGQQLTNMAVQFVGSAAPGLVEALQNMLEIGAKNKDLFTDLGTIFGTIIVPVVNIVLIVIRTLTGLLGGTADALITLAKVAKDVATGKLDEAGKEIADNFQRNMHRASSIVRDDMVLVADTVRKLVNGPKDLAVEGDKRAVAGGGAKPKTPQEFKDGLDALKSAQEAELALLKAQNALKDEVSKEEFDKGLENLKVYYAERRQIITEESNRELEQLDAQIQKQKSNPDKAESAKAIDRLSQQKTLVQTRAALAQTQLDEKELSERKKLNARAVQIEQESAVDLERIFQQKITDITNRGTELELTLQQLGFSASAAAQQREGFTTRESSKVFFENALQTADRVFAELQTKRDVIQADIQAGLKSQVTGELEIVRLEQNRLPALRAVALELLKLGKATNDIDLTTKATEMVTQLDEVERHVKSAEFSFTKLKAAGIDALHAGVVEFLTTSTDQFHDLGSAALAAADQVVEALRRMAAEALATEIFSFLTHLVPGHASGGVVKKAGGGLVEGPGTETSDSVPALLSRGEFVVRASSVRKPGILPLLQRINTNVGQAVGRVVRKASGGLIGGRAEDAEHIPVPAAFAKPRRSPPGLAGGAPSPRSVASGSDLRNAKDLVPAAFATRFRTAFPKSRPMKRAAGGPVFGAGTETSDSVPAMLSRGEFVVRASSVRQPGVLPLLNQINFGHITHDDIAAFQRGVRARIDHRDFTRSMRTHFADGGLVAPLNSRMFDNRPGSSERSSSPAPAAHGKMRIELEPGLVIGHMKSPAGQAAWLEVLAKNRRTVQGIVLPGSR